MMAFGLMVAALSTTTAWGARPAMLFNSAEGSLSTSGQDDADLTEPIVDGRMPQESARPSRVATMHNSTLVELRGHGQLIMQHEGHDRRCNCANCRSKLCYQVVNGCGHIIAVGAANYGVSKISFDDDVWQKVIAAPIQMVGAVSTVYINNFISASYPCLVDQEKITELKKGQLNTIRAMRGNLNALDKQIKGEQISRQVEIAKLQQQVNSLTAQLTEAQQQLEDLEQMEATGCSDKVKAGVDQCVQMGCCTKDD